MTTVIVIPDTQIPFIHEDSVAFIKAVIKKYKPKEWYMLVISLTNTFGKLQNQCQSTCDMT
jgi:hypothetical protein